jgi:tungstate transport system ATP-binding protein
MPETPVYRLEHIRKAYGRRLVLDIERLDIQRGEILGLVGPSGSGKSTLLRLLNFLEPFDSGRLQFEELTLETSQSAPLEARRRVTTVFQRPMLLERSVWDNVAYGLKLRARVNGQIHQPVEEALRTVGMDHLARQSARTLSGGEAQRVALARALVLKPEVLLLDEPTANLDPANGGLIESVVRRLNAEQGVTIVLVTHNIFQARRLAQRAALLYDGRLVEVADTQSFFNNPQDERTQAFVKGEMIY